MFNFVFLCPKRWSQINARTVSQTFFKHNDFEYLRNDYRNAKLHFQMTFPLPGYLIFCVPLANGLTDAGPRFVKKLNPSFIWGLMGLTGFRKIVSLLFCYLLMHIFCWTRNPILSPVFFAGSLASRDWNCWSKLRLLLLCVFFAGTFYSAVYRERRRIFSFW